MTKRNPKIMYCKTESLIPRICFCILPADIFTGLMFWYLYLEYKNSQTDLSSVLLNVWGFSAISNSLCKKTFFVWKFCLKDSKCPTIKYQGSSARLHEFASILCIGSTLTKFLNWATEDLCFVLISCSGEQDTSVKTIINVRVSPWDLKLQMLTKLQNFFFWEL